MTRLGVCLISLSVLAMALPGMAAAGEGPSVVTVPGGELDTGLFDAGDVYSGTPRAAVPGPACRVAAEYVRRMNLGQFDKIADLYTADAVLLEPFGSAPAIGHTQIDSFYQTKVGPFRPHIVAVAFTAEGRNCVVELATRTRMGDRDRYILSAIDHFTVDNRGKAVRMLAYMRPAPAGARSAPSH